MVPAFLCSLYLTFYKTDISLRRTASAGPKGVRLRGGWLYKPDGQYALNSLKSQLLRPTHISVMFLTASKRAYQNAGFGIEYYLFKLVSHFVMVTSYSLVSFVSAASRWWRSYEKVYYSCLTTFVLFNYSQWKELRSLRQRETNDDVFFLEVAPRHRRQRPAPTRLVRYDLRVIIKPYS